jgi:hypothetical protein
LQVIAIPEKFFTAVFKTYLYYIKWLLTVGKLHIGKPVKYIKFIAASAAAATFATTPSAR